MVKFEVILEHLRFLLQGNPWPSVLTLGLDLAEPLGGFRRHLGPGEEIEYSRGLPTVSSHLPTLSASHTYLLTVIVFLSCVGFVIRVRAGTHDRALILDP